MKKLIGKFFTLVGGMTTFLIFAGLVIAVAYWISGRGVPDKTILKVNLTRDLVEDRPDDPITQTVLGDSLRVRDVVEALEKAAEDDRVRAVIAQVGATNIGLAQIQEIRDAILVFRRKGKLAFAHAETFGEFGPGNGAYYLATAFDEIHLQPSGDVGLTGLIAESPFLRGTLEKLDIIPRLDHRREYKTAMNLFTEREYTAPHQEEIQRVLESHFGQIVQGIVETRGLSEPEVQALINRGPFLGEEAKEVKLVDAVGYLDEVYTKLEERVGRDAQFLSLSTYLSRAGRPHSEGEATIALIYGVGAIQRGKGGYDPLFGSIMGSSSITSAFRMAIKDNKVKAILFRIESPGGSYVASDAIWRETIRAQKAGKPVIVSMGNVAASGGYFVAMAADKIVAHPATLTGSIGVIGGKMLTKKFWEKLGVSWDELHTSDNATMWTGLQDYTPAEWERFQAWLDRVYTDFLEKVAAGRGLPIERVREIAKGRVWTGEDAKKLGLVDELGGFSVALRLAKEAAGIPPTAAVHLKRYPPPKSTFQILLERLVGEQTESEEEPITTTTLAPILHMIRSLFPLLFAFGGNEPGALIMSLGEFYYTYMPIP